MNGMLSWSFVLLMLLSALCSPAFAWEYPDGSHDTKIEFFGPRADSMLIKLYGSEVSEWETGLEAGEIDVTDCALDSTHLTKYTTAPWNAQMNVYSYSTGAKVMSKSYVGPESGYMGVDWYGVVNEAGYGIDSEYSFLNMHILSSELGGTIRCGFSTATVTKLNPLYASTSWDNKALDLIGYESLLAKDPYSGTLTPWVAETYDVGTYVHADYGLCSKVAFTLRNDVYWSDGTQLSIADVMFTFVECNKLLATRSFPQPTWWGNMANVLDFRIYDPLNFEVLFDSPVGSADALVGLNRILPKHVWKPICQGAIGPKSGSPWDPTTFAPDPNLVGSGPWRLDEYVPTSHILLQANRPGSVVDTGITTDPNTNSAPVTSPKGYFKLNPIYANIHTDTHSSKIDPVYPHYAVDVHLNFDATNLWLSGALDVEKTVEVDGSVVIATHTVIIAAGVTHSEDITVNLAKGLHIVRLTVKILSACAWQNKVVETTWPIRITIPEDFTGTYYVNTQLLAPDCKVDLKDVFAAAMAFGSVPGGTKWNKGADINNDYKIDLKDYFGVAGKFGKWPWRG